MSPRPDKPVGVRTDQWPELRAFTPARLALGRAGAAQPTAAVLAFQLAHAQARDAVHAPLDVVTLAEALRADGWQPPVAVASRAADRAAYLARPDWGRRLSAESLGALPVATRPDVVMVISDGLSATAVQRHAVPLLAALKPLLGNMVLAPLVIATQARVALADEVGERLAARVAVSLIGERPGLSSPDSLGAYITAMPCVGCSDAGRHCISNIRPQGLAIDPAATQLAALIHSALAQGKSGVTAAAGATRASVAASLPRP